MSRHPELISVIISTYNWPRALTLVLDSLAGQADLGFEVVVADDGSTQETAELVAARALDFPVPLRHVWQEDQGFRAAAARNRAVAASHGDYLLFLDGDCLVRASFVATHRRLARPGWFVAGNRILLGDTLTAAILAGDRPVHLYTPLEFLLARRSGGVNRLLPLLRLPNGCFRRLRPRRWQGAMTCNLAVWREDFYRVNGFDENFVGWGHEDAEFVGRLINAGVFRKEGRFALPVLHLWHQNQHRGREAGNLRRLHEQLAKKATRAEAGVDRYTP
ncbi:MAG TPA: glycosyltransferase family 2 protein [Desulfurivibrionaceae bacterium]|nr:glycosyltransferase family 2 protein [Desulfurivibrionaceae bacterium]